MKRRKMSKRGSKRLFTQTGKKVNPTNMIATMRGGIRL